MLKHNIVILEDEGIVAKDPQLTLERLDYRVAGTTSSGEVAIEMACRHLPDLVLMDLVLKGQRDGIEARQTHSRGGVRGHHYAASPA